MIIVDASVAVKWVMSEAGSEEAAALLEQRLGVPALWLS
jgi:predicted nucleic acid-binding protein